MFEKAVPKGIDCVRLQSVYCTPLHSLANQHGTQGFHQTEIPIRMEPFVFAIYVHLMGGLGEFQGFLAFLDTPTSWIKCWEVYQSRARPAMPAILCTSFNMVGLCCSTHPSRTQRSTYSAHANAAAAVANADAHITCTCIRERPCTCTCAHILAHAPFTSRTHRDTRLLMCAHTQTYKHAHTHTQDCTFTHTYTYTHATKYTGTQACIHVNRFGTTIPIIQHEKVADGCESGFRTWCPWKSTRPLHSGGTV